VLADTRARSEHAIDGSEIRRRARHDDVRVGAVSARSAGISLRYPGGGLSLAAALSQKGLSMTDSNNGLWLVRNGY
jgi:hypothetical protein